MVNLKSALLVSTVIALTALKPVQANESLPSWHDGPARDAIIEFVERVTDIESPDFVAPADRIATFDNDGCLWSEQPLYFQGIWALERIRAQAADHPEWHETEPYRSAIAGDMAGMMSAGEEAVIKMLFEAHGGLTSEEFRQSVGQWLATAKHPQKDRRYLDMVFQPMLELLDYLRANDFKTFIVSGGGIDFVRVFSEEAYGIPPEQVIGSTLDAHFEMRDGVPTIVKDSKLMLLDDKAGKPVGIYRHIGKRPIFAAGNSDGDLQMLQYTTVPRGEDDTSARFGLIVHHTDEEREFSYDRESHMGRLDQALDLAGDNGWLVVDMKNDWKQVYPE